MKVRQRLQLVYEWRYLFLVVDGRKGKLYWSWIDSMKADMMAAVVKGLKQQTEVAAVVWDGAPSHRNQSRKTMRNWISELPDLKISWQYNRKRQIGPHSPEKT